MKGLWILDRAVAVYAATNRCYDPPDPFSLGKDSDRMTADATSTLAIALGAGAVISAFAARVRTPAVLPLLAAGVLLGPSGLGWVEVSSIGGAFHALVALSIGLLVFEGGLHLDRRELGRAPRAVLGLLTISVLFTWLAATALGVLLLGLDFPVALVLGSMLIVTGPTVIQPILRHVRLSHALHAALSAEAILIDPIGVIISVVTMEAVLAYYGGAFSGAWAHVVHGILMPVGGGLLVGLAAGGVGYVAMRFLARPNGSRPNPGTLNVAATGICMLAISAGEMVVPEGGLVAATIAAVILANTHAVATSDVRQFKEQVATIIVGMLFILLASQIDIDRFRTLRITHAIYIACLLLLIRPISVLLGTHRSRLAASERLFAGLFAPRGIVAASIATIVVVRLTAGLDATDAHNRVALITQVGEVDLIVYAVIGVSVLWATISARPMARALCVLAGPPRGVMIVGAHLLGREAARSLATMEIPIVLVDLNSRNCELATRDGLDVVRADATDTERMTEVSTEFEIGWVFAWTGNDDVDKVVARWADRTLGTGRSCEGLPQLPIGASADAASASTPTVRNLERLIHDRRVELQIGPWTDDGTCIMVLQPRMPMSMKPSVAINGKQTTCLALRTIDASIPKPQPPEAPIQ